MSDEQQTPEESPGPELEREERRLERLRLVTSQVWPAAQPPVREADQWRGSGGTGRFPQLGPEDPAPDQAA